MHNVQESHPSLYLFQSVVHGRTVTIVINLLPKATFTPSIQANLVLPRSHPPLTSTINTLLAILSMCVTLSLLSAALKSPAPFRLQLFSALLHSWLYPFVILPPNISNTSSPEHSLSFSQHFSYSFLKMPVSPLLSVPSTRHMNLSFLQPFLKRIFSFRPPLNHHSLNLSSLHPPHLMHERPTIHYISQIFPIFFHTLDFPTSYHFIFLMQDLIVCKFFHTLVKFNHLQHTSHSIHTTSSNPSTHHYQSSFHQMMVRHSNTLSSTHIHV